MKYRLSQRSLAKLDGVDPVLVQIVKHAITVTRVDFGVICGLRTVAEQKVLVKSGASQTMRSKHLTGAAVDLMAYVGPRASWELSLYDDIADAMAEGARTCGRSIRWGAAWTVPDIRTWDGTMQDAMNSYIDECRAKGRRPFIDAPHFELS